jgi:acetylornithine/N-succinyldiaminopimelate aminotransferase
MTTARTIEIEDKHSVPFFTRIPISIERGEGVCVWDEDGRRYLDFTAGLGVTCLGHAHPVITKALEEQSRQVIQNPYSGIAYSPARARLMELMAQILPPNLTRVFFSNSGAEANDAAIKLARKVTGRLDVVSTDLSFHGRTISTASATGQAKHRERFNPLMPNYRFVPFDDVEAIGSSLDDKVAAVILEPVQGEGGVRVPSDRYLEEVSALCKANGTLLIIDEIQTGFCRTGPFFAIGPLRVEADFLTLAKGIAGGFPFGAFAVTEEVASKLERGDHGGTYSGNPLGCAVAYAVIRYMIDNDIPGHVEEMGAIVSKRLEPWPDAFAGLVVDVRSRGLLAAVEMRDEKAAFLVCERCREQGLFVLQTQVTSVRMFPPLIIGAGQLEEGLDILERVLKSVAGQG